ncbi:nitric oxide synthase oxygenase [Deinococcus cellulosilyticus]|uniref:nitric oxide synthase oxygenase n=1 Tax=Deinococcus cellulosilyticus TaxID=401558 RepID=UPI001C99099E|nr:nitric oxide synthase oxygenase [Deinococcus cellulosilyticus]
MLTAVHPDTLAFLRLYHLENHLPGLEARLAEVERLGHFEPSAAELLYAAKVAWRNSVRCVGRNYWQYLHLQDGRHLSTPRQVFDALVQHLLFATHGGNIRPTITVFRPGVRVHNDQLIRYAGYGDGLGDPRNRQLTDHLIQLGWTPPEHRTPFDVLPLALEVPGCAVQLFELPREAVLEVEIVHPTLPWFRELGLKWHAVPAISSMVFSAGGIEYSCAPFNGWYVETEIAARNFGDVDRYNLLPEVATRMGLNTRRHRNLWKDRALVELHEAVLYSFERAGVKVTDHHTVAEHFERFCAREKQAGREVKARWSWIVPPISGSTSPQFHQSYDDAELKPGFEPGKCPFH